MSSRPFVSMWRNHSWSFNSSSHREGQVLPRQHPRLTHNHQSRHDSKANLRRYEPVPVDAALEHWIKQSEHRINQRRPQHGSDESSKNNWSARKHGEHRAVEQADQRRNENVKAQGNCEAVCMEGIQLCGPEFQRLRVNTCCEKVDRIPDTSGFQHAICTGQNSHRYASRKSTLHACRNWIGVDREPGALISENRNALNETPFSRDANVLGNDRHTLFMLMREHFAKPADASCERKHGAEQAHRGAGHEACKQQGAPKSQDKGPSCWRGNFDFTWNPAACARLLGCQQRCHFAFLSVPKRKLL